MYRCIIYVQSCVLHVQRLFSWTVIPRHLNWSASHSDEIPWGVGFSWLWHMKIYENITKKHSHTKQKHTKTIYSYVHICSWCQMFSKTSKKPTHVTMPCPVAVGEVPSPVGSTNFSPALPLAVMSLWDFLWILNGIMYAYEYIYIYYTYSCWSQCRNDLWMYIFVF